jgi:hypothetical protein
MELCHWFNGYMTKLNGLCHSVRTASALVFEWMGTTNKNKWTCILGFITYITLWISNQLQPHLASNNYTKHFIRYTQYEVAITLSQFITNLIQTKLSQHISICLKPTYLKLSQISALQIWNEPRSKEQLQKHIASNYYTNKQATCHTSIWCLHVSRTTPSSMLLHYFLLQRQVVATLLWQPTREKYRTIT